MGIRQCKQSMPGNRLAYVWSVEKYVRHAVSVVNMQDMGFLGDPGKIPVSTGHNNLISAKSEEDEDMANRTISHQNGWFPPLFSPDSLPNCRTHMEECPVTRLFLARTSRLKKRYLAFSPLLGRVFPGYPAVPGGAIGIIGAYQNSRGCTTIESTDGPQMDIHRRRGVLTAVTSTGTKNIFVTLQPSGSRIRKNSDVAQFHTKCSEFLRIRLPIDAYQSAEVLHIFLFCLLSHIHRH